MASEKLGLIKSNAKVFVERIGEQQITERKNKIIWFQ